MDVSSKFRKAVRDPTLVLRGLRDLGIRAGRRLRYHDAFYRLDPERVLTKRFEERFQPIGGHAYPVGNYYLDDRAPLGRDSIVYSFGVLTDVAFDLAVSERFDCSVFLYDPTPVSVRFMARYAAHPRLRFFPVGVWTSDTSLTFVMPRFGGSASAVRPVDGGEPFVAPCKELRTLMRENGHTHIDVLKMDIEGAALPITKYLIEHRILPTQIVVEYERPTGDPAAIGEYFHDVAVVCEEMERLGYEIFRLPRASSKYYSIELLFRRTRVD